MSQKEKLVVERNNKVVTALLRQLSSEDARNFWAVVREARKYLLALGSKVDSIQSTFEAFICAVRLQSIAEVAKARMKEAERKRAAEEAAARKAAAEVNLSAYFLPDDEEE